MGEGTTWAPPFGKWQLGLSPRGAGGSVLVVLPAVLGGRKVMGWRGVWGKSAPAEAMACVSRDGGGAQLCGAGAEDPDGLRGEFGFTPGWRRQPEWGVFWQGAAGSDLWFKIQVKT